MRYLDIKTWGVIAIIAVLVGLNGFLLDFLAGEFFFYRMKLLSMIQRDWLRYCAFTVICLAAALFSTFLCEKYSIAA